MVNREARHHGIERIECGQRIVQAVFENRGCGVVSKALPQPLEHQRREVERDELCARVHGLDQCGQPAVAASEIEKPIDMSW